MDLFNVFVQAAPIATILLELKQAAEAAANAQGVLQASSCASVQQSTHG